MLVKLEPKTELSNHIVLSFISLKQSCYIETTGSGYLLGQFLKLFKHSTNNCGFNYLIEPIQQNTPELRDQILEFIDQNSGRFPALNGFRSFLKLLPESYYFLIVNGKVTDTLLTMKYFTFLTKHHNDKGLLQEIHEKTYDWGTTFEHYNMHTYGHQRRNIGGTTRKIHRICRFCNTMQGETNEFGGIVTFKNKSHAISEALGNKRVVNLDECDACNDRFSSSIEPSLINYFSVFRSLHGLKGKNGVKQLVGKNFVLDPIKGFDIQYDGLLDPESNIETIKTDLELRETFIPQDIYRCLVKFVLSVVDEKDITIFSKTIEWINGKFNAERLPQVSFLQAASFYIEEPMLFYFQRKDDHSTPYMIGELHYADMVYVFIIPFCSYDNIDYAAETDFNDYWKEFNTVRMSHDWSFKDLSGTDPIRMVINLDITGISIGENTFVSYKEEGTD